MQTLAEMMKLDDLLEQYNQRVGRRATAFRELIEAGLLRSEPTDPSGAPYGIDADGRASLGAASRIDLRLVR